MAGSRKLGRASDHRKAMLRAMVTYLLENGKIETTVARAKEVRAMTEKMITLGKTNDLHSKRQAFAYITKEAVVKKLFDEISPKYADQNGGYTRIVKIGPRRGLKIPFITGGPGPADAKEPHQKPQVITCKRNYSRWFGSQQNVLAVPGARQNRPLALNID